ncbi:MAG: hypothetical protein JWO38_7775 [Gemmataceae bacterium]|nr:hypothetical protein [Gemmataceae bacterium]
MYPSGPWEGFWVQELYGRQPMTTFTLHFATGEITGEGKDVIGRFVFTGSYDVQTGEVVMMKQYLGKHQVWYRGTPDGEGCIQGTWSIGENWKGPFLIKPVLHRPRGDEPIQELG